MKKSILRIMLWAAAALVIPLAGNLLIDGWNWSWHDFIFAWVFWVIMATTILYVTSMAPKYRAALGIIVFLAFAAIWVMLATG